MHDAGPVSNDGQRTGGYPSGAPVRGHGAADAHRRPRVRATPAVGSGTRDGDDPPRVTVPVLQLVPPATSFPGTVPAAAWADAVAAAGREATLDGAGSALVEGVTSALDLGSAHLYVLGGGDGGPCLGLAAHTGSHSAFMSDAPTVPLSADVPIARALRDHAAIFEADPHGLGEAVEGASGVGRWRSALGAQAEAVLPLIADGRAIGVLGLAWRAPRAFGAADRRGLESLAAAAAAVIGPLRGPGVAGEPAPAAPFSGASSRSFSVDRAGRVTPGTGASCPSLRIAAATAGGADPDRAAFSELATASDGRTAIAVGTVRTADGSAADRAQEAGRLLCGWLSHGLGPVAALDALAAWAARETGVVGGLDAIACVVDTERRFVGYATLRHVLLAILARDGRFHCDTAATGPATPARERVRVLLPGDRLAVWSGDAPALAEGDGPAAVRSVVADAGFPEAESAAVRLAGPEVSAGCRAQAALIVDVTGPGRP